MEISKSILNLPPIVLFFLVVAVFLLSAEAGAFLAASRRKSEKDEPEAPVGTAVGAMLGLMAFMLAFTFSLTEARFAERKKLVIKQATAIGTCYLRTSLIPEQQRAEIRKLFQEYMVVLLQQNNPKNITQTVDRLEELNLKIWNETASLRDSKIEGRLLSLFAGSVNEVIDVFTERKTVGLVFKIPGILWSSLFLLSVICQFSFGFQIGLYGKRRIFFTPLMSSAVALVIVLIADMDASVDANRFKVSQQPLLEVQKMMQQPII
jgi:hypothetical protein